MSQENVDAFKRGLDAYNRRDLDALLRQSSITDRRSVDPATDSDDE